MAVRGLQLDRDRIAAAGLGVVDTQGVSGFTIRAVAEALGVTPMALYRHVKDKADLAALVVDRASQHHPVPVPSGDWREDLLAMARWNRAGAMAHPGVRELWRTFPVFTPDLSRVSDLWIGLWQKSGLCFEQAVEAAIMSNITINGLIAEEEVYRGMTRPDEAALARLPYLRLALSVKPDPDEMYETTVRSLIEGLHAHFSRKP